jgi:hypothetical protein
MHNELRAHENFSLSSELLNCAPSTDSIQITEGEADGSDRSISEVLAQHSHRETRERRNSRLVNVCDKIRT